MFNSAASNAQGKSTGDWFSFYPITKEDTVSPEAGNAKGKSPDTDFHFILSCITKENTIINP